MYRQSLFSVPILTLIPVNNVAFKGSFFTGIAASPSTISPLLPPSPTTYAKATTVKKLWRDKRYDCLLLIANRYLSEAIPEPRLLRHALQPRSDIVGCWILKVKLLLSLWPLSFGHWAVRPSTSYIMDDLDKDGGGHGPVLALPYTVVRALTETDEKSGADVREVGMGQSSA